MRNEDFDGPHQSCSPDIDHKAVEAIIYQQMSPPTVCVNPLQRFGLEDHLQALKHAFLKLQDTGAHVVLDHPLLHSQCPST